jgi:hypothetical protein
VGLHVSAPAHADLLPLRTGAAKSSLQTNAVVW